MSELKASLSKYVAHVKSGEELIVTVRGEPVAKLVPIPRDEDPEMTRMRELQRKGIVTLGTGKIPDGFWDLPRAEDPEGLVLKAVLEEREEGW